MKKQFSSWKILGALLVLSSAVPSMAGGLPCAPPALGYLPYFVPGLNFYAAGQCIKQEIVDPIKKEMCHKSGKAASEPAKPAFIFNEFHVCLDACNDPSYNEGLVMACGRIGPGTTATGDRNFKKKNLQSIHFFGTSIPQGDFKSADLRYSYFGDALSQPDKTVVNCNFTDADFRGADLRGSNLADATNGCNFEGAKFNARTNVGGDYHAVMEMLNRGMIFYDGDTPVTDPVDISRALKIHPRNFAELKTDELRIRDWIKRDDEQWRSQHK